MKTELQKQKDREYSKKYYQSHKAEIKSRRKAKKSVKDALSIHQLPTPPLIVRSNVQEVYISDFYSAQLARIEKVLWWICFAISFVGITILFKW